MDELIRIGEQRVAVELPRGRRATGARLLVEDNWKDVLVVLMTLWLVYIPVISSVKR